MDNIETINLVTSSSPKTNDTTVFFVDGDRVENSQLTPHRSSPGGVTTPVLQSFLNKWGPVKNKNQSGTMSSHPSSPLCISTRDDEDDKVSIVLKPLLPRSKSRFSQDFDSCYVNTNFIADTHSSLVNFDSSSGNRAQSVNIINEEIAIKNRRKYVESIEINSEENDYPASISNVSKKLKLSDKILENSVSATDLKRKAPSVVETRKKALIDKVSDFRVTSTHVIPKTRQEAAKNTNVLLNSQSIFSQLTGQLVDQGLVVHTVSLPHESMIGWSVRIPDNQQPKLSPSILFIMEAERIHSLIMDGSVNSFLDSLLTPSRAFYAEGEPKPVILVLGSKAYATHLDAEANRIFQATIRFPLIPLKDTFICQNTLATIEKTKTRDSWLEVLGELWLGTLEAGIKLIHLEKTSNLAQFVVKYTQFVSWAPFANLMDAEVGFCPHEKHRVGINPTDTWIRMLGKIPRTTPEMAELIVSRYPTIESILCAYKDLETFEERQMLLSTLVNNRGRSLGPVLSARIARVLLASSEDFTSNV